MKGNTKVSPEHYAKIVESYVEREETLEVIGKRYGVGINAIADILEKCGVERRVSGKKLFDEDKAEIVRQHQEDKRSVAWLVKTWNVSKSLIRLTLNTVGGGVIDRRGHKGFSAKLKSQLVQGYKNGVTITALMEQYDVTYTALHALLVEQGCIVKRTKPKYKRLSREKIEEIVTAYTSGEQPTLDAVADRFGYSARSLAYHLKKRGVSIRPRKMLSESQVADIAAAYVAGVSVESLSSIYDVSATTVRQKINDVGVVMIKRPDRTEPGQGRRVSNRERREIADRYEAGESPSDLANEYRVGLGTIRRIRIEFGVKPQNIASVPDSTVDRFCHLYQNEGWETRRIAEEYAVDRGTVARHLRKRGVKFRGPVITGDLRAYIWDAYYNQNMSGEAIAKSLSAITTKTTVYSAMRKWGMPRRSQAEAGKLRRIGRYDAFDDVRNDEAAQFWAGYLITDGCIYDNEATTGYRPVITLSQSEEHRDAIEKLGRWWNTASFSLHRRGVRYWVTCLSSREAIAKLVEIGIHSHKTFTADPPVWLVKSPHFMRGVICGDGWVSREDKKRPYVGVCGASEPFMLKIIEEWRLLVGKLAVRVEVTPPGTRRQKPNGWYITTRPLYSVSVTRKSEAAFLLDRYFRGADSEITLDKKQRRAEHHLAIHDRRVG